MEDSVENLGSGHRPSLEAAPPSVPFDLFSDLPETPLGVSGVERLRSAWPDPEVIQDSRSSDRDWVGGMADCRLCFRTAGNAEAAQQSDGNSCRLWASLL